MYCSGALMLLLASCFRDLTVSDEGTELLIAFGPLPLFKRRLQYSEFEKVEQARSTIMDGWGIHMSPSGGWVWNLWGYDCVDVWYREGRKIRIGTDDAVALATFLETKVIPAGNKASRQSLMCSFEFLPDRYAICRLAADDSLPQWALQNDSGKQQFVSLNWTPDELSVVCRESIVPDDVESETDWMCMRVAGKLDFSLVGILAQHHKISGRCTHQRLCRLHLRYRLFAGQKVTVATDYQNVVGGWLQGVSFRRCVNHSERIERRVFG